jgi:hypothetical protein
MGNLKLTSSAFSDGCEIPRECGYKNGNKVPSLTVSGIPEGVKSLALIMDDPDAMGAVGKVWVHWIVWDMLASDGILTTQGNANSYGTTDFGTVGYGGPAPPDKKHTYVFKLYALDLERIANVGEVSTKDGIEKAMKGHIVDQATLTGTYAP